MVEEEDEDPNVKYWKTKYDLLYEDYGRTKERTEKLEVRLLEIVEENDRIETVKNESIENLRQKLSEANVRIEQLEAACFRYKNQTKRVANEEKEKTVETENPEKSEEKQEEEIEEPVLKLLPISVENRNSSSSVDGITRSPEFHAGEHLICEYHKLPVLAKGEGFIYGFRWNESNKIHII